MKLAGADALRGGAFKPRIESVQLPGTRQARARSSSPRPARRRGFPIVTEAVDEASFELVDEYADIVQVGARNMQNYELLETRGTPRASRSS